MRPTLSITDPRKAMLGTEERMAQATMATMGEATEGLKEGLRDQVERAGLGPKVARTIRSRVYPVAQTSLNPAGYVWSKAPKIIDAFDRGATILPLDGRRYLAIPTEHVPLKRRGKKMTPLEVEVAFNQDLILRRSRKGTLLAFVNVVPAKNRRGFRAATRRRLERGRDLRLVLMFTLVPSVKLPKRLDLEAEARLWASRIPDILARRWS